MGNFTFIDLFAGIGGFRLAAESLGGECIGFSEINKDAIGTYCANFNETEWQNFGDIRKIKNLPAHDLLTAGVPCQSWSIAGKNLGFDDERGLLWNDTIWLLRHSRPKAFVFENVKGLADPRNSKALEYIMEQVNLAGYYAKPYLINAYDYGMLQHRIRLYIIGFAEKRFFDRFNVPQKMRHGKTIADIIGNASMERQTDICNSGTPRWSLSCNSKGQNDYFLFNDIRNGHSTIHSWDIQDTTQRQKEICLLLLRNRRKKMYGRLDGNPLSLDQLQSIDPSVTQEEIDELVNIGILKPENYLFKKCGAVCVDMSEAERAIIGLSVDGFLNIDDEKIIAM